MVASPGVAWAEAGGHVARPGSRPGRSQSEKQVHGGQWRRVCPDGPPAAAFVLGWLLAVNLYVPLGGSAALGTPTVTDVGREVHPEESPGSGV